MGDWLCSSVLVGGLSWLPVKRQRRIEEGILAVVQTARAGYVNFDQLRRAWAAVQIGVTAGVLGIVGQWVFDLCLKRTILLGVIIHQHGLCNMKTF